jgi:hypothetical protein
MSGIKLTVGITLGLSRSTSIPMRPQLPESERSASPLLIAKRHSKAVSRMPWRGLDLCRRDDALRRNGTKLLCHGAARRPSKSAGALHG